MNRREFIKGFLLGLSVPATLFIGSGRCQARRRPRDLGIFPPLPRTSSHDDIVKHIHNMVDKIINPNGLVLKTLEYKWDIRDKCWELKGYAETWSGFGLSTVSMLVTDSGMRDQKVIDLVIREISLAIMLHYGKSFQGGQ